MPESSFPPQPPMHVGLGAQRFAAQWIGKFIRKQIALAAIAEQAASTIGTELAEEPPSLSRSGIEAAVSNLSGNCRRVCPAAKSVSIVAISAGDTALSPSVSLPTPSPTPSRTWLAVFVTTGVMPSTTRPVVDVMPLTIRLAAGVNPDVRPPVALSSKIGDAMCQFLCAAQHGVRRVLQDRSERPGRCCPR